MNKKFSKKKLKKMIDSNFTDLSSEDIKKLIETEVAKGAQEVDTDYIDLCFKLLALKDNQIVPINRKPRTAKTLLIAAIVFVLMISVVTASAYVFDFDIPDFIAELVGKDAYVDINLEYANTTAESYQLTGSDLAKELEAHGITPVTFPEELIKEDCKIVSIEYSEAENAKNTEVTITFEYQGNLGRFAISNRGESEEAVGYNIKKNVISGQMVTVNGMDILIFEGEDYRSVEYKDRNIEYNIYIEGDMETVMNIVNSIK